MNKKTIILLPLIIGISIGAGVLIGNFFIKRSTIETPPITEVGTDGNKINQVLYLIQKNYVDTVSNKDLVEKMLPKLLRELDPHSVYIPKKDVERVNEDLEGSFSGVGIQFTIQSDTIMAVAIISGGPSEKAGLRPGDRIVKVDDSLFVGKDITNEKVMKKLRGKKGTDVILEIKRNGIPELLTYKIVRGDIPLHSVDISYKIKDQVGYIKVSKFSVSTYKEFITALAKLKNEGCQQYIIDLRGNSGGYLDQVILMINEFLSRGELMLYTEGVHAPRSDMYADGMGMFQYNPMVVLIDEWSASASEIFAGAIQDNDRGTIIGRRSFGKGLVQQQIPLPDSSAIRLTISRYYTPSGRSIQKPYKHGDEAGDYEMDIYNRYLNGELDQQDSTQVHVNSDDSIKYLTREGRVVYGGGGITPDIFVPRDTLEYTKYFTKAINYGYLYEFGLKYSDDNREMLIKYKNWQDLLSYLNTQPLLNDFTAFAETKGLRKNVYHIERSKSLIMNWLNSYIIRNILGDEGFYPVLNLNDPMVTEALDVLEEE